VQSYARHNAGASGHLVLMGSGPPFANLNCHGDKMVLLPDILRNHHSLYVLHGRLPIVFRYERVL
jgi:hypothetical protein